LQDQPTSAKATVGNLRVNESEGWCALHDSNVRPPGS